MLAIMSEILLLRKLTVALYLSAQSIKVMARQIIETKLGSARGMLSEKEEARSMGPKNTT
jgi:hypothetical protein